jgi:3-phenylpropionate/trans-cinnamate dioxygenase ferredoxin component
LHSVAWGDRSPSRRCGTAGSRRAELSDLPRRARMAEWIDACAADDLGEEDVLRFDHDGRTFAIYRTDDDRYFATDGLCTHEKVHLADGVVTGTIIECPKHFGRFDVSTGEAKGAPVCIDLETYPVKVEDGRVLLMI